MLTRRPAAADSAPCDIAGNSAAISASAAVAATCHLRTVRIGLLQGARSMAFAIPSKSLA